MSGTNDFQPFAVGAGANVLTQANYLALAALGTGFQSGVAQSAALNKVWRQSSIMAAVLAQMIVDQTGQNATDDGTTATLESNLVTAIKNISRPLLTGLIGSVRNARMTVAAASSSATFTADQIVVGTALNGLEYLLTSFNKTINLATTGAGGMDTGSAPTSGYVALYAIYNPSTSTASILATNATSAAAPTIYSGANMPSGYTASALISVWPTNSSGQFIIGNQYDRAFKRASVTGMTTTTQQVSLTSVSISSGVPLNAKSCSGSLLLSNTNSSTGNGCNIASDANGIGQKSYQAYISTAAGISQSPFEDLQLITVQTMYYTLTTNAGTVTLTVSINGYTF